MKTQSRHNHAGPVHRRGCAESLLPGLNSHRSAVEASQRTLIAATLVRFQ